MKLSYKHLRDRRRRVSKEGFPSMFELFGTTTKEPTWAEAQSFYEDLEGLAPWIRESADNAAQFAGAMCNVSWCKGETEVAPSFRSAGRIASIIFNGDPNADYMDFYLANTSGEVPSIMKDHMRDLGWSFNVFFSCGWSQ